VKRRPKGRCQEGASSVTACTPASTSGCGPSGRQARVRATVLLVRIWCAMPEQAWTTNKAQVADLGLYARAGDGNRTRAISLGSTVQIRRVGRLSCMNGSGRPLTLDSMLPLLTGVDRPFWCTSGAAPLLRLRTETAHAFQLCWWGGGVRTSMFTWVHGRVAASAGVASGLA
jgi:hypothetical protein